MKNRKLRFRIYSIFLPVILISLWGCKNSALTDEKESTPTALTQQSDAVIVTEEETLPTDSIIIPFQRTVLYNYKFYSGTGFFKFAILGPFGVTWSNDGLSSPEESITLPVNKGFFSINLGDTSIEGMAEPITKDAFPFRHALIQTWFSPDNVNWEQLPNRMFASPYSEDTSEPGMDKKVFPTGIFIHSTLDVRSIEFRNTETYILKHFPKFLISTNEVRYSVEDNLFTDYYNIGSCQYDKPATYEWTSIGNWLVFELVGQSGCTGFYEGSQTVIWIRLE